MLLLRIRGALKKYFVPTRAAGVWPSPNFLKPQPYKLVILSQYGEGSPSVPTKKDNKPITNKMFMKKYHSLVFGDFLWFVLVGMGEPPLYYIPTKSPLCMVVVLKSWDWVNPLFSLLFAGLPLVALHFARLLKAIKERWMSLPVFLAVKAVFAAFSSAQSLWSRTNMAGCALPWVQLLSSCYM